MFRVHIKYRQYNYTNFKMAGVRDWAYRSIAAKPLAYSTQIWYTNTPKLEYLGSRKKKITVVTLLPCQRTGLQKIPVRD